MSVWATPQPNFLIREWTGISTCLPRHLTVAHPTTPTPTRLLFTIAPFKIALPLGGETTAFPSRGKPKKKERKKERKKEEEEADFCSSDHLLSTIHTHPLSWPDLVQGLIHTPNKMFTEGLDNNALKWVSEKERSLPSSNMRPTVDPLLSSRNRGHGFRLPATSRFHSGHLPANTIPLTQIISGKVDGSISASDSDMVTDSEEEVSGFHHSLDSSPQDERVQAGTARRYDNAARSQYTSDYGWSDVSSSMETTLGLQGKVPDRYLRRNGRHPLGIKDYTEEEFSDSAASSEFSTTQTGSINGAIPASSRSCATEKYASNRMSNLKSKGVLQKENARNKQKGDFSEDDIASAPFCNSPGELKRVPEKILVNEEESRGVGVVRSHDSMPTNVGGTLNPTNINDEDFDIKSNAEKQHRNSIGVETVFTGGSLPPRTPAFHASALGPWHAVIAYDACVRLCLNAWARGCMEAPMFLENECLLLRDAFGLQQVLLQSEEELLVKQSSDAVNNEGAASKPKKIIGKMKVQVRKVKTILDAPTGCSILSLRVPSSLRPASLKMDSIKHQFSNLQSTISSQWRAIKKIHTIKRIPENGSFSRQSSVYVHAGTQYLKQVSSLLKTGVTSLRNSSSSYEVFQETYTCFLRLKSSAEEDAVPMQPGSGEAHIFFPDSAGDDLIVEIQDSKGKHFGRVFAQLATITEDSSEKTRWWPICREPEHELVGKLQLYINYSESSEENAYSKYGTVAETVAYDLALEVAMKVQKFQQRNLSLHDPWKWILREFASYYGISDIYTKLRYLSYVMDVATPTADCLTLVLDLLMPVLMKGHSRSILSHQENRILGETKDQIVQILAMVFENYKSLDESSFSGLMDIFRPATGIAAPALEPAVKLYTLLHDILSPEAQTNLCHYFQIAAKKRSRRHLTETDEYVTGSAEGILMDPVTMSTAYQKMTSLCMNIKNEIHTDIEIHNQHILPSFVDLPNLSTSIYSTELCNRLRAFLTACPPTGPSTPVAELVIATADFQGDLASWKICPVKGGVDAKELFHLYILVWIQDKRLSFLETCKLDKIKWSGVRTQHSTTPFVDEMYDRLREMLSDYEVIICRWPEYIFVLENAIADVENAVVEALDKQYADILAPLKENLAPKKFGLKYVQKLTKRSVSSYIVPDELGILLNSMKRMLDTLRPRLETKFRSWASCMPINGNTAPGDRLSEVAVMLRTKFRNYLQAVVEKLAENTKLQATTKLKKVLQNSKGTVVESDVRGRMQPLREQLTAAINHLHTIFETQVFVALCRGYWDRMGQDVLSFLESRKENKSWYRGSRIAASVLDDTFASQMQQLLGNALQEKDLEPPRSITEVRSILWKDAPAHKEGGFYY
ncbi:hypothetical protein SAY87_014085 [Trapa incisa]|uniref:Pesticidal crystal cry8Ba protein n=1 Tax=Trapa incisa TaxID=236973 RepID=A0AAN7GS47_9MYRT|nr:hypothetical protein SAY87_014085 [Trapa incisa]